MGDPLDNSSTLQLLTNLQRTVQACLGQTIVAKCHFCSTAIMIPRIRFVEDEKLEIKCPRTPCRKLVLYSNPRKVSNSTSLPTDIYPVQRSSTATIAARSDKSVVYTNPSPAESTTSLQNRSTSRDNARRSVAFSTEAPILHDDDSSRRWSVAATLSRSSTSADTLFSDPLPIDRNDEIGLESLGEKASRLSRASWSTTTSNYTPPRHSRASLVSIGFSDAPPVPSVPSSDQSPKTLPRRSNTDEISLTGEPHPDVKLMRKPLANKDPNASSSTSSPTSIDLATPPGSPSRALPKKQLEKQPARGAISGPRRRVVEHIQKRHSQRLDEEILAHETGTQAEEPHGRDQDEDDKSSLTKRRNANDYEHALGIRYEAETDESSRDRLIQPAEQAITSLAEEAGTSLASHTYNSSLELNRDVLPDDQPQSPSSTPRTDIFRRRPIRLLTVPGRKITSIARRLSDKRKNPKRWASQSSAMPRVGEMDQEPVPLASEEHYQSQFRPPESGLSQATTPTVTNEALQQMERDLLETMNTQASAGNGIRGCFVQYSETTQTG